MLLAGGSDADASIVALFRSTRRRYTEELANVG